MVRLFLRVSSYASAARRWWLYVASADAGLSWYEYANKKTGGFDGYVQHPHYGLLAYWYIENDKTHLSFVW